MTENQKPKTENRRKRILIVNPYGIGDVLFTTPMIEAIKTAVADAYIGYLCNMRTAPLLFANPNVDDVFIYEKDEYRCLWRISKRRCIANLFKLLKDVRAGKFDIAFDLSLAQEYGLFLKLAGVKERVGYNYKNRGIFLTKKVNLPRGYADKHMVEYYADLLALKGIRPAAGLMLNIYIPQENKERARKLLALRGLDSESPFICITPGAGASWGVSSYRKQWPIRYFAELTKALLAESDMKIVLLGSIEERPLCDFIAANEPRCITVCGETELLTFAAIVKKAKLLITNDGGPLHIAVACGTRTVSIFGPVDDKVYGPYHPSDEHIVIKNESLKCRPCYKNFKLPPCENRRCLDGISPESVLADARELLRQDVRR